MTAPLKTIEGRDIAEAMREIGARAKTAARTLALAPSAQKDAALAAMANAIRARTKPILAANAEDLADARAAGATALCLKAGNAVILRGGSEGFRSSRAIHAALAAGLEQAGLPQAAIALVPTRDRAAVGLMLSGLDGTIDVIVPRGGKGLVGRVQSEARVPVFAHLEGVCHVYVDKAADLAMAKEIVLNAKMRRTGVCGAAETLLVDRAAVLAQLKPLVRMLLEAGCEVRGDDATRAVDARVKPANEDDWSTEYLDAIIAAKVVDGVDAAIAHIER